MDTTIQNIIAIKDYLLTNPQKSEEVIRSLKEKVLALEGKSDMKIMLQNFISSIVDILNYEYSCIMPLEYLFNSNFNYIKSIAGKNNFASLGALDLKSESQITKDFESAVKNLLITRSAPLLNKVFRGESYSEDLNELYRIYSNNKPMIEVISKQLPIYIEQIKSMRIYLLNNGLAVLGKKASNDLLQSYDKGLEIIDVIKFRMVIYAVQIAKENVDDFIELYIQKMSSTTDENIKKRLKLQDFHFGINRS